MDEKILLVSDDAEQSVRTYDDHDETSTEQPSRSRTMASNRTRRILPAVILTLVLWLLMQNWSKMLLFRKCAHRSETSSKVALEAHIMSKCPDAKDCLRELIVPSMERVHDKVNFTLSFIGTLDPQSDAVSCKHGPSECLGNMIILCAAKLYPDPKLHLGFANCLISDYSHIPQRDLVEDCALTHGVDFEKMNDCISEEGEGVDLLIDSIARSAVNNVTRSCTVRLDGQFRCIRDGGEWYNCEDGSSVQDLVHDIDVLYDRKNS